jgi:UDP-N-acetylglucosamine transferase subunit ALG13
MLPFDRLVRAMDAWAKEHAEARVFAQIGETSLHPANMEYCAMISPSEYRDQFAACDVAVSHVGMGTVITASEFRKPLVMLPRRTELKELTNNHQFETAKWLEGRPGIRILYSEDELAEAISESIGSDGGSIIETGTRDKLVDALRQFISN